MSKFLDDLFDNLEQPENDQADEVAEDIVEVEQPDDEAEETTEDDGGEAEVVEEVEEPEEASKETDAEDDDDTELTPAERKAYGRLKALQDERTKRQSADEARKAAEAELTRVNQQLAEMQRQQRETAAQNLPDAYEDPQGYIAAREAQFQEQLTRQQLGNSIARAVDKYGEAEVQEAAAWFENQIASNPSIPLRENMLSQADQMEYVLSSYKQSQRVNAFASGDYSTIVAELQKAGYNIQKTETTPSAEAPTPAKAPANIASPPPAPTAPAAPKRSKLAGTAGSTTAAPKHASKLDTFIRR
jgi:hypothetical protein